MTSITASFKQLVEERSGGRAPKRQKRESDVWMIEATRIAHNLVQLSTFLSSIRRAYLDLTRTVSQPNKLRGNVDPSKGLAAWEGLRWFTDRERDEVDFQVKTMIKRCMERIKDLENAENARQEHLKKETSTKMSRFLSLPSEASNPSATQLATNRTAITMYLNNHLSSVSKIQQTQQETRIKRQMERHSNSALGGGLALSQLSNSTSKPTKDGEVPSMFTPNDVALDDDEEPIESLLSKEQIAVFESETSELLAQTQSQLASIKAAEASLLEISAMQTQLVMHLTQQAETIDQLWEDATVVSGRVGEGNEQLVKARERNRESRFMLLVFILGASFTLLFLEMY